MTRSLIHKRLLELELPSLEEFAEGLTNLTDSDSVWRHTADLAHNLGFSSCSLTMAGKHATGLRSTLFNSDLSSEFHHAYRKRGLIDCDPFLQFSCSSLTAKRIGFSCFPKASIRHQKFLDHAAAAGATNGIGIPVRTTENTVFGGWVFSSVDRREAFERVVEDHLSEAHLAGVLAYERMATTNLRGTAECGILSDRERECLLWLCAGLRVSKISDKLMISDSAVNLYITNAKRKLGAKTREQAIARAIFSGEISL